MGLRLLRQMKGDSQMSENQEKLNEQLFNVIANDKDSDEARFKKVKYLVRLGADVNARFYGKSVLSKAMEQNVGIEVQKFLREKGAKECVISKEEADRLGKELFSKNGDLMEIDKLLKKGANVDVWDDEGNTLLIDAVLKEDEKEILFWVEKGANINARGNGGLTPLMASMWCIGGDNINIAKLLMDLNADIELKDKYGQTALMHAVVSENVKAVEVLLEKGADIYQKNKIGETILYKAKSSSGSEKIVKLLVEKEKNGKNENKYGYGFLGNPKVK